MVMQGKQFNCYNYKYIYPVNVWVMAKVCGSQSAPWAESHWF